MRPNIEEIRESANDLGWTGRVNVNKLIAYIDELENMPLVQTVLKLQEENERLCKSLESIAYREEYTGKKWIDIVDDLQDIARQALEGDTK